MYSNLLLSIKLPYNLLPYNVYLLYFARPSLTLSKSTNVFEFVTIIMHVTGTLAIIVPFLGFKGELSLGAWFVGPYIMGVLLYH